MPRGGKRKGTGRPKSSGENREPTKTVRVPLSFAEKIPELLEKHQAENSVEDLKLPAKAHEECLPLEGLAWDAFESFCLDLIARFLNPQKIYHYGTQGDDQQGVDIIADLKNGEKWAFQCKQWQKFNRSDATKVVKQAEGFEADRYILLLSRVAGVEVRKVIADSPLWEVWDVRDISQKVRDLLSRSPEASRRLVRDHFHPEWQNAFLGISKLTPFVSSEDFFYSWLDVNKLFNHTWKLEGRDDALKGLHDFVTSNEKKVAILPGRGGIGKTKLLYEFAKTFEHPDFRLWFVEDGIPITPENADSLPLYPCIIVLDDAHRREQDMATLQTLIRNRTRSNHPEVKLVLSSRPHAIQYLQTQLDRERIDNLELLDELKELSRPAMKALARQAIGQNYAHFADQLAAIAHDSPLVAIVGGRLLADQAIPLGLLERNEDFRRIVLSRFEDILIGQVSQLINPELCRKILKLTAATAPIKLSDEQFQQAASEFLGIDKVTLVDSIGTLEKAGVLLRRGNHLRITPDVLADHILHRACLTEQGDSTGYAREVFEAFREIHPTKAIRNLAELDWRIRSSSEQETNLLDTILQSFQAEFKQACNLDRCKLLDLIKEIAYYQPDYSWEIVQLSIRHPAITPEDESIPKLYHSTHSNVLSKLPEILKRISYTFEYVPVCCNLLWELGRDNTSRPHNNYPESIRILIDLAEYGADKSVRFNEEVLKAIERWLQEPDAHDHIYSPLDILDPFFEKDIDHDDYDGRSLEISTFLVDHKITQEIRSKALKLIESLLNSNNVRLALRALESLGKALEELRDRSGQPLEEANQWWEPEQLEILEMIHSLATRDIEPLVQLKAIKELDQYAQWSGSSAVKQKAQNIIDLVPRTDGLKLTGALSGSYQWNLQADEFLKKYPMPQQGIQILNERLQVISTNGSNISTGFLSSLAELNPSYSIELCEQVLETEDCLLTTYIASMLYPARKFDIERVIKVVQVAINSGTTSFCKSFAKKYGDWENDIAPDAFRELIQKLLIHPELDVRKFAIASLDMLIQSQSQLAISLALNVEINDDTELAKELFQSLNRIPLEILTEQELIILLSKLERINHLSGSHISKFLIYATKKIPSSVLQLILNRIEVSVEKDQMRYKPLPSDYRESCLHHLSSAKEYEEMLREIRNLWFNHKFQMELIFSESYKDSIPDSALLSIKLEPLYKELYKEVSFTFVEESKRVISPTSLKLLNEWINSSNGEKIKFASELIRKFPSGFIFGYLEFVSNLLEQADKGGYECYKAVSSNLRGTVVSGVKTGVPGQPFPADIQLRDQAAAIAEQSFKGTPVRKFFDSLVKYAKSAIDSQQIFYEERWE